MTAAWPDADGFADDHLEAGRDVHFSFGPTQALRGTTLSACAGEIVAVSGPSGSGKSALSHCLADILVPDSGEIHFDGRRIDTLGRAGAQRAAAATASG